MLAGANAQRPFRNVLQLLLVQPTSTRVTGKHKSLEVSKVPSTKYSADENLTGHRSSPQSLGPAIHN